MLKSHEIFLEGLYNAILSDCADKYPDLHKEFRVDHQRLTSLIETRGSNVLLLDFPALGKHLDRSLSSGRLCKSGSPLSGGSSRKSVIPRLFRGLWIRVFDDRGLLRLQPDIQAIQLLRALYYGAKKWRVTCNDKATYKEVAEFYQVDAKLDLPTLQWDQGQLDVMAAKDISFVDRRYAPVGPEQLILPGIHRDDEARRSSPAIQHMLLILQGLCDRASSDLGHFDPLSWKPRHGPGAVSDLRKSDLSKFEFPYWSDRLANVFPLEEFGFPNYSAWAEYAESEDGSRFKEQEFFSRLIAVPKTQKGPRLIACEPTANLWCQQIIRDFLMTRIGVSFLRNSVHFHDQKYNRDAAQAASKSNAMATLDLSAASDRMSLRVVERVFRTNPSLLKALHASRTRYIENLIDKKSPRYYELRKLSTMGSAITFPVQSIVFSLIAIAAVIHTEYGQSRYVRSGDVHSTARRVLVFGDDIIIPSTSSANVRTLLEYLGFKVNISKTHETGKFRESCGMDAFDGIDVTPAYALQVPSKTRPESIVGTFAAAHNFFPKKMWNTVEYLQSTASKALGKPVPGVPVGSGLFGYPSSFGYELDHLQRRYNSDLARHEFLVALPKGKVIKKGDRMDSRLLQYFTEDPSPMINWSSGFVARTLTSIRSGWEPLGN